MNHIVQTLVCLALPVCVLPALAQPPAPSRPPAPPRVSPVDFEAPGFAGVGNPKAREVLEKVLIARLSEDLALDDAQTVLLVRRYTEVRERLAELRQQRQEKIRELREALDANADNERLTGLLEDLQRLDREAETAKREAFDTMSVDLTQWQKARLYIFFSEFENQLRRLLMDVRRERFGERPGPRSPQRPERPEKPEGPK